MSFIRSKQSPNSFPSIGNLIFLQWFQIRIFDLDENSKINNTYI